MKWQTTGLRLHSPIGQDQQEQASYAHVVRASLGFLQVDIEEGAEEEMLHDLTDVQIAKDEEGENAVFSAGFKKLLLKPWTNSIVVKLMGRSVGYFTLKR